MTTDTENLRSLYAMIEALRTMAAKMGYSAMDAILAAALLEIERRLNDPAGPEAFTAPRLRH